MPDSTCSPLEIQHEHQPQRFEAQDEPRSGLGQGGGFSAVLQQLLPPNKHVTYVYSELALQVLLPQNPAGKGPVERARTQSREGEG